jgi:hypothetical protein
MGCERRFDIRSNQLRNNPILLSVVSVIDPTAITATVSGYVSTSVSIPRLP